MSKISVGVPRSRSPKPPSEVSHVSVLRRMEDEEKLSKDFVLAMTESDLQLPVPVNYFAFQPSIPRYSTHALHDEPEPMDSIFEDVAGESVNLEMADEIQSDDVESIQLAHIETDGADNNEAEEPNIANTESAASVSPISLLKVSVNSDLHTASPDSAEIENLRLSPNEENEPKLQDKEPNVGETLSGDEEQQSEPETPVNLTEVTMPASPSENVEKRSPQNLFNKSPGNKSPVKASPAPPPPEPEPSEESIAIHASGWSTTNPKG